MPGQPVRILYIDDDVGLGILLSRALSASGYAVDAVVSSEEALKLLAAAPYDLVALDHNLVNELGLDLIPRIQALPDAPRQPSSSPPSNQSHRK